MLTFKINYLIIGIIVIANIFFAFKSANGQAKQEFYNLLPAYEKAMFRYSLANDLGETGEVRYWSEQYLFYKQKLENIISIYDQAARNDPQTYCLTALELYDAYYKANLNTTFVDPFDDTLLYMELSYNLQTYCGRFDIYYNRNQRM